MASLLSALGTAGSGLHAARMGVQVAGENIANANTPGYHRRSVSQSAVGFGGAYGVRVDGLIRADDQLLHRQLQSTLGGHAFAEARAALMPQLELAAADLGEAGLGAAVSNLLDAFSALSSNPSDQAVRREVLAAADALAGAFNRTASGVAAVADAADSEVAGQVNEINRLAAEVATLNAEITVAEASGDASHLHDRRSQALEQLSKLAGATSFTDSAGQANVLIGGRALVQGDRAAELEATPDAALDGKLRVDLVEGNARTAVTGELGGRLGGLIDVRDRVVPETIAAVDQLAQDIATAIDTQHQAGFGLDGVDGRTLFEPLSGASGAAAALALRDGITTDELAASATAAGVPGDGDNAAGLSALRSGKHASSGSETFAGALSSLVSQVGSETRSASEDAAVASDRVFQLQAMQQSTEGVSVDEEMVHLVQYQRSYQASTKVLQVIDDMLARIMEL